MTELEVQVTATIAYIRAVSTGIPEDFDLLVHEAPRQDVVAVNRAYVDLLSVAARSLMDGAFAGVEGLSAVAVSLYRPMIHRTLGHRYHGCVLAVLAQRAAWEVVLHENVTPENALKNGDLRFRYDSEFRLEEVTPFRATPTLSNDATMSLADLDPKAFEARIRDLLLSMGYLATLTKASHDGGVDIEAVNPQPIVGGRLIVQCKRQAATVGAAVVRDLYGAVTHARATKGILVTTSSFSADAVAFAADKPIELIDGPQLLDLIQRQSSEVPASGLGTTAD